MKIGFDNNFGNNINKAATGVDLDVAYRRVRLVDPSQKPTDICIFREIRGKSNLEGCLLFSEPDA